MEEIPDRALKEGNINNSPDPKVMGKIASEYRTKSDLDKNVSTFMHKLTQQYREEFPGEELEGFIHFYSEYPVFYLLLMLEAVLMYALTKRSLPPGIKSTRTKPLFLYLDATGSLLRKLFQDLKRIYVYSLVMAGEGKYPPLEVSTFASSSHTTEDVCFWLDRVARNMKLLTTRRPVVDKLGTDCSLPLLQAASRAFNGMSLTMYINLIFDAAINGLVVDHLTVLHICSSHMFCTARDKAKSSMTSKADQILATKGLTALIHSTSLRSATEIVYHMLMVFGTIYEPENFRESTDFLLHSSTEITADTDKKVLNVMSDISKITSLKTTSFGRYFATLRKLSLLRGKFIQKKNARYNGPFMAYLFNFLGPYYPLYSAIQIKRFGICRDSAAPIENRWMIERKIDLKGKKHLPAHGGLEHVLNPSKDNHWDFFWG
ncbi:hypothetical protein QAD02_003541 [Eretmocerus hayati]|uniref:Uncharacterized protein n=1 Tax=Eretmocerus hayati TaxID=131215 RepID=A0ACC2NPW5_9HYME|nr:hypothetical protein QAD02_003541 [Eretmocerus hayati]